MKADYKYRPVKFYTVTFSLTFLLWLIGARVSFMENNRGLHMLFLLPGLMAPFIISHIMLYKSKDSVIKRDFYNRLFNIRLVRTKYIPVFLFLMPAVVLASAALSLLLGQPATQFQLAEGFSFSSGFVPVMLTLFLAATFEELGWRGYAFDSLQNRFNYFKASLIFSILWSAWHLPLVFVKDSYQFEIWQQNPWFAVNFFVGIIPMGIIISWICIRSNKSIIAAIAFHFIINMWQELLAITQVTKCIETGVLTIVTAMIIWLERDLFFQKVKVVKVEERENYEVAWN